MREVPRLPRNLMDMTLDQALDLVAKTFGYLVVYEECVRPDGTRFFDIYASYICGGKWFEARRAPWDKLVMKGYETGICPVHHVPLQRSVVYRWSHSRDLPEPRGPDPYFRRETKYPFHLDYYERSTPSLDFHKRTVDRFCPVCQRRFEAEIKQ